MVATGTATSAQKEGRRRKELASLAQLEGIIVIYESPHRILKTLASIDSVFPGRPILIGREMTKMFEEFIPGTAASLSAPGIVKEKGEFAIAIDNTADQTEKESDDTEE